MIILQYDVATFTCGIKTVRDGLLGIITYTDECFGRFTNTVHDYKTLRITICIDQ